MESTDLNAAATRPASVSWASNVSGVHTTFFDASEGISGQTNIESDELHIWEISLQLPPPEIDGLRDLLSPHEVLRAGRFHFVNDARRFIVGRGTLRSILSSYTGAAAHELQFADGPHGKPALAFPASTLCFNLSHSGDLALCAVTSGREVGIDVERRRPCPEADSIVERYFTPHESASFRLLPVAARDETFFCWWTRKEAYLKALGIGHSGRLDTVDVLHGPDSSRWTMGDMHGLPGHYATVVIATAIDPSTCI